MLATPFSSPGTPARSNPGSRPRFRSCWPAGGPPPRKFNHKRGGPSLGARQERKQATRARVLAAARDLFDEIGYEETTIRMVAQRAEVSVGSVFTTFAGKAELLSQVMGDRVE